MERAPVQSSHIRSIGYQAGNLEVEFASGAVWQYENVSPQDYSRLMQAESKGQFFHQIKSGLRGTKVQ